MNEQTNDINKVICNTSLDLMSSLLSRLNHEYNFAVISASIVVDNNGKKSHIPMSGGKVAYCYDHVNGLEIISFNITFFNPNGDISRVVRIPIVKPKNNNDTSGEYAEAYSNYSQLVQLYAKFDTNYTVRYTIAYYSNASEFYNKECKKSTSTIIDMNKVLDPTDSGATWIESVHRNGYNRFTVKVSFEDNSVLKVLLDIGIIDNVFNVVCIYARLHSNLQDDGENIFASNYADDYITTVDSSDIRNEIHNLLDNFLSQYMVKLTHYGVPVTNKTRYNITAWRIKD